jgi:uncharacterized protein
MTSEAEGQGKPVGLLRRIVAFPISLMCIGLVAVIGAAVAASNLYRLLNVPKNTPLSAAGALIVGLAAILAYKAFKRWVERRPDRELPLNGLAVELPAGLLAGFLLFAAMALIVMQLGGLAVNGMNRGIGQLWSMTGLAVVSGITEEIAFRGLIMRQIEAWLGTWWALAITSAIFGFGHLFNPGATLFAGFAITMEAGLLLGACYLYTRRLWLPIGLHAAWNFTQGWVFSAPVSGSETPEGLLVTTRVGPDWLTGGAFGLEASVVAMVVATFAGLLMLWLAIRRGRIIPPAWRRTDI